MFKIEKENIKDECYALTCKEIIKVLIRVYSVNNSSHHKQHRALPSI